MKRVALAIVSTVASLVMLLSFKTHSEGVAATPPAAVSSSGTTSSGTSATGTSSSSGTSTSSSSSSTKKSTSSSASKTYTGSAIDTRYGPVQVQITVKNGKVTNAQAIEYPQNDPRDQQINSYAVPVLNSEAEAASSASIDMVSGATFTSQGYLSSLQSALDKAGL